jgi:hypothetical protein
MAPQMRLDQVFTDLGWLTDEPTIAHVTVGRVNAALDRNAPA